MPVPTPVRVERAAGASTKADWEQIVGAGVPRLKPIARLSAKNWLVEADAVTSASANRYVTDGLPARGRFLLKTFIDTLGLGTLLAYVDDAAREAFGPNVVVSRTLGYDSDLGGDFVRVAVSAPAVAREQFRAARRKFDDLLDSAPDSSRFDRVVVVASRSDA